MQWGFVHIFMNFNQELRGTYRFVIQLTISSEGFKNSLVLVFVVTIDIHRTNITKFVGNKYIHWDFIHIFVKNNLALHSAYRFALKLIKLYVKLES